MATISQLEARQRQLMSELNRYRKEADECIRANEERYSRAYEEIKEQSRSIIENDREKTRQKYKELLDKAETEASENLNALIKETEQRYDEVKRELDEQIAEEREKVNKAQREQERITKEYRDSIKKQKQYAEEAIRETRSEVEQFLDAYPVKWFFSKREELYRNLLSRLNELYESGIYQAATGLSDDLKMRICIDKAQIEQDINKWFRYFSVLKGIIDSEHTLIHKTSRDLSTEELSEAFFAEENISDRVMTPEMFNEWIDSAYKELIGEHNTDYDFLESFLEKAEFSGDGIPSVDTIMKCMGQNFRQSDSYSAERLYDRAKNAMDRMDREANLVRIMRSRLMAYNIRQEMFRLIWDKMEDLGYECTESYYSGDGDRREAVVAVFEDYGQLTSIEVQIVPVFSIVENKWYNGVGYVISSDRETFELEQKVNILLHDEFDVYGVGILPPDKRRNRYSPQERTANYSSSLKIMINGHA